MSVCPECGINIPGTSGLEDVTRLTFYARGKTGAEVIEFRVGNIDVSPSPGESTGKETLSTHWTQYEIPLEGLDLSNAINLFQWIADDDTNPDGAVFFLDDIHLE